jgi:hypothetical protein
MGSLPASEVIVAHRAAVLRIILRDGSRFRLDFYNLLTKLRNSGIPANGSGRVGAQDVILMDQLADAERAIALLAKLGIDAVVG